MADAGRPLQLSEEAKAGLNRLPPEEAAQILTQRQQWAREMRLIFSPRDMIFPDGTLNPEYVSHYLTDGYHLLIKIHIRIVAIQGCFSMIKILISKIAFIRLQLL